MALVDETQLAAVERSHWEDGKAGGTTGTLVRDLCETVRKAWEAIEELRATLALTQAAKSAWEDAANVEGRAHALLRREALRTQDHAKQLRHALGVMLANADHEHWIGCAHIWDECQAVYDGTGEVEDGDDD